MGVRFQAFGTRLGCGRRTMVTWPLHESPSDQSGIAEEGEGTKSLAVHLPLGVERYDYVTQPPAGHHGIDHRVERCWIDNIGAKRSQHSDGIAIEKAQRKVRF